jgi:hypothetical protein
MGCDPARLPSEKRGGGGMLVDDFLHEQATCFNVKGKGLVVMTSCGHRGNTLHLRNFGWIVARSEPHLPTPGPPSHRPRASGLHPVARSGWL